MACNCTIYACLDVVQQYTGCPSVLTLRLPATETTTWPWEFEFNGRWFGGTVDVTTGQNIVLPWVFNEHYIHLIKFYQADGDLFNDTCYKLDTSKVAGSYSAPSEAAEVSYLTVALTEDMLTEVDGQQVVTIAAIAARDIILIADGNQIYNTGSFTQVGNSWTYTNGAVNGVGQIITILFG